MCIGIALYNTDSLSSQQAYGLARLFFQILNLGVTEAAYRNKEGTYQSTTINELAHLIDNNSVDDFRLYHKDNQNPPWVASFGYITDHYGSFYHLDMQCAVKVSDDKLEQFLKAGMVLTKAPYGMVYTMDNVVDAYEYVLDEGVVPLPNYEKHFVWRDETLPFGGAARYKDTMLRMVYPYNLLNLKHLKIPIAGMTLQDLITSNHCFGELIGIDGTDSFIWKLPTEHLEAINKACGEAGILIAWSSD